MLQLSLVIFTATMIFCVLASRNGTINFTTKVGKIALLHEKYYLPCIGFTYVSFEILKKKLIALECVNLKSTIVLFYERFNTCFYSSTCVTQKSIAKTNSILRHLTFTCFEMLLFI